MDDQEEGYTKKHMQEAQTFGSSPPCSTHQMGEWVRPGSARSALMEGPEAIISTPCRQEELCRLTIHVHGMVKKCSTRIRPTRYADPCAREGSLSPLPRRAPLGAYLFGGRSFVGDRRRVDDAEPRCSWEQAAPRQRGESRRLGQEGRAYLPTHPEASAGVRPSPIENVLPQRGWRMGQPS